jgi:hypothetical protein
MRSLRRHHRARRIAAVARQFRTYVPAYDSDHVEFPRVFRIVRLRARTRTPCSCHVCKETRRYRAKQLAVESHRQLREAVAVDADRDAAFEDVCLMDDLDDTEDDQRGHREQLAEWERTQERRT